MVIHKRAYSVPLVTMLRYRARVKVMWRVLLVEIKKGGVEGVFFWNDLLVAFCPTFRVFLIFEKCQ